MSKKSCNNCAVESCGGNKELYCNFHQPTPSECLTCGRQCPNDCPMDRQNQLMVEEIEAWINENCGNIHIYDLRGTAQLFLKMYSAMPPDQSAKVANLCDGCKLWPCGHHSPIGVPGCVTETCANRKPTVGARIAELEDKIIKLQADRDELVKFIETEADALDEAGMSTDGDRFMGFVAKYKI